MIEVTVNLAILVSLFTMIMLLRLVRKLRARIGLLEQKLMKYELREMFSMIDDMVRNIRKTSNPKQVKQTDTGKTGKAKKGGSKNAK